MLEVLGLPSLPGGPAFLIPTRQRDLLYSQAPTQIHRPYRASLPGALFLTGPLFSHTAIRAALRATRLPPRRVA
jgi:hypothetical protein